MMPIFADPKSQALMKLAEKVAHSEASVLILGESGTGKEILARFIHQHSSRKNGPFIAVNCAAIPENMLEAMLFGYEKGAFTGAHQRTLGKFELAQGGTLLLDEISEMPLFLQAKLLRVLQEKEVEHLGAHQSIKLDIRVLSTSNRDLLSAVKCGDFREDLYFRLNVFSLKWPALSERPKDILPLAQYFIAQHTSEEAIRLESAAEEKLKQYRWPGNVRELSNVIERALILKESNIIQEKDIVLESEQDQAINFVEEKNLSSKLKNETFSAILLTLKETNGKKKEAAKKLGISDRTLRYKMAEMKSKGMFE